jgi:Flp pilus assembly protein TadB
VDERRGSEWFGLPAMIGLLAFVAAAKAVGVIVAIVAVVLVYLIIGAVVWAGRRRPNP